MYIPTDLWVRGHRNNLKKSPISTQKTCVNWVSSHVLG